MKKENTNKKCILNLDQAIIFFYSQNKQIKYFLTEKNEFLWEFSPFFHLYKKKIVEQLSKYI